MGPAKRAVRTLVRGRGPDFGNLMGPANPGYTPFGKMFPAARRAAGTKLAHLTVY